ncbi:MAG: hypothetical protein P8J69_02645 [Flavobacteriaceae bacterium]|nr:hypothetical protein [Flavobacteriaceae bacterium]
MLNFVNFGVLAAWIATIIIAQAVTTHKNGVLLFLSVTIITLFLTDLLKIFLAKKLKRNLTPRFIIKTKKWVSISIIGFGVLLLTQGLLPDNIQEGIENIPETFEKKLQ